MCTLIEGKIVIAKTLEHQNSCRQYWELLYSYCTMGYLCALLPLARSPGGFNPAILSLMYSGMDVYVENIGPKLKNNQKFTTFDISCWKIFTDKFVYTSSEISLGGRLLHNSVNASYILAHKY